MLRFCVYTLLIISGLAVLQVKQNLERKLLRLEFNYLYKAAETKIRLHHIQQKLLDKEIVRLREVLGEWNDELNPYE